MRIPPKVVKKQLRTRHPMDAAAPESPAPEAEPSAGEEDAALPAVAAPAAPATGRVAPGRALPVLEAFQEFLEEERRRTRNRILILSGVFLIVLLAVAGVSFLVGYTYYHQLALDFQGVRGEMAKWKSGSSGQQEYTEAALAKFAEEAVNLRSDVTNSRAAFDLVRSNLDARVTAQADQLNGMGSSLDALRQENTSLRNELAALKSGLPSFTEKLNAVLQELAELRSASPEPPPAQLPEPAPRGLTFQILPQGASAPITWRLPAVE